MQAENKYDVLVIYHIVFNMEIYIYMAIFGQPPNMTRPMKNSRK